MVYKIKDSLRDVRSLQLVSHFYRYIPHRFSFCHLVDIMNFLKQDRDIFEGQPKMTAFVLSFFIR